MEIQIRPAEVPGPRDRRRSAAASARVFARRRQDELQKDWLGFRLGLQTGRSKGSILTEIGLCTSPGSVKKMPQI